MSPKKSLRSVFAKKTFFLDLKTRSVASAKIRLLIEDIEFLGGTIEQFFSKEVTTVISDAPEWKLANPTGAPDVVSPGTPCSLKALSVSPWSPATPSVEDKKTPKSRVETILERARQQAKGTCDVIENAHSWGLKIWSLDKVLAWFEKFKTRLGPLPSIKAKQFRVHHTRSQSVDSCLNLPRQLVPPFLKFEATNRHYRPVVHEFKKPFPRLHFEGRSGTSPFYSPDTDHSHHRKRLAKRLLIDDDDNDSSNRRLAKRQRLSGTSRQMRETKVKQSGFCEICDVHYSDLELHINTTAHKHVVGLNSYWAKLDLCIGLVNMNSDDSVHEVSDGR